MTSIRDRLANASNRQDRFIWGGAASVSLEDLLCGTSLNGRLAELKGRSVLLLTHDQFAAALAIAELDGVASRIIICPPDLASKHLPSLIEKAGVDAIVSDDEPVDSDGLGVPLRVRCGVAMSPSKAEPCERARTEWVLLTSGTTGLPKMIAHSLAGLTAAIKSGQNRDQSIVWGTFYDIRRYGGLQIFLRAVLGGHSLVLSGPEEPLGDFLVRLGARAVTNISGTPSHWRRALMSSQARAIAPRYVRLSGEIADQSILNALRAFYQEAAVGHAFASTEAGVGFEVNDGLEGFPASFVGARDEMVMKIEGDSLRIRSARAAVRYIGDEHGAIADDEGFVDTGDVVERRGDRYHFLGRRSGVINVGGLKVYPEEVEAVINDHPAVRMSVVRSMRSPITGSLVAADVVLRSEPDPTTASDVKREILRFCHENLAAHKVPATIRIVPALQVAAAGKLARHCA